MGEADSEKQIISLKKSSRDKDRSSRPENTSVSLLCLLWGQNYWMFLGKLEDKKTISMLLQSLIIGEAEVCAFND